MHALDKACMVTFALVAWGVYAQNTGQTQGSVRRTPVEGESGRTMKTISRGTDYAVSSLMPQATLAAEHMIRAGGNAFDAFFAGQAVLGVVQPAANGLGSDAELLVYDAKAAKVYSINAEGTAPKLATIEWYKAHNSGKLPVDNSLRGDGALCSEAQNRSRCTVNQLCFVCIFLRLRQQMRAYVLQLSSELRLGIKRIFPRVRAVRSESTGLAELWAAAICRRGMGVTMPRPVRLGRPSCGS